MDYKISDICSNLGVGKSTVYKRINAIKNNIPEADWKKNEYFYYTNDNKLFFTEKGFKYIREYNTNNVRQNNSNDISIYQNQIIEIYKQRIEHLETENKRLLDIISIKEQKEIAEINQKALHSNIVIENEKRSFWDKFLNIFNKN